LEHFRTLEDEEGNTLTHNFRPVQDIGDRIVLFSSPLNDEVDNNLDGSKSKQIKKKAKKNSSNRISVPIVFILFNTLLNTI
jgi:hypothetical protein